MAFVHSLAEELDSLACLVAKDKVAKGLAKKMKDIEIERHRSVNTAAQIKEEQFKNKNRPHERFRMFYEYFVKE